MQNEYLIELNNLGCAQFGGTQWLTSIHIKCEFGSGQKQIIPYSVHIPVKRENFVSDIELAGNKSANPIPLGNSKQVPELNCKT